ncbi:unnamed protein product [Adineta steineri]|uniref:poly(A)-specific ribonuclease n=1 Tax=Adineta steineri TaxID=433720 RepID=A0A818GFC1_9BILA|nr:unnamed protein product [Adineta steineri]
MQHSSISVDQSSAFNPQRNHSPQHYYYQSAQQHQPTHFYPYQSQLSLTNTSSNSNDQQQNSSQRSLPLSTDIKNDSNKKKSDWNEIEITGNVRTLSPTLWTLSQLTSLYLNDNQLSRLPSEIACLTNLVTLDISNNKLRNLPSEIGELITLRELNLTNNSIRNLPYEIGKLFRLQSLGLLGNPLSAEILSIYTESNGLQKLLSYFLDNFSSSLNVTEPRRATVSCKNIFSSSSSTPSPNDRSIPTSSSSSSRRHANNNSNLKRNINTTNNVFTRLSNHSTKKQQPKLIDVTNKNLSNANVFHIPFYVEQINDNGKKILSNNNNNNTKLLRTPLNPLSPAFFSTRHKSLLSEQKQDTIPSSSKVLLLSETSDYGSGTDPDLQSIQHVSPLTDSSAFTFDFDETFSCSIDDANSHASQTRRISLSSTSSSPSSSSLTSPSSSMSNLSSLSSSSEIQTNFLNQNRLSNKKFSSINNYNNNTSNDMNTCYCEKENQSNRKRNRLNTFPIRRYTTTNYCENCQIKRTKLNSRSKIHSNRPQKPRLNNRYYDETLTPIKFAVDLTGLNVNYTIEYLDNIKCSCSTTLIPNYNPYRCKCSSINEWPSFLMMNSSFNEYNDDVYYIDTNNNPWIPPPIPTVFNYYDLHFTKLPENNPLSIYFDDNSIIEASPYLPTYYLRSIQPPPTRSWLRLASPNTTQPTAIFTVMNYNILCDKYATRHVYGYCPSWALKWDYRRKQILDELRSYAADIIALQEIETDQFHLYFLPELQKIGYDGVFSPKSRAKTMCEQDRRFVDGCAIFYRTSKFRLIKDYLVEFNQLAMSAANGPACHDMMNRVMTKDNIGLVAFLETKEEIYSHTFSNGVLPSEHKQMLFVCTAHIHWDPEYCDVKVVQTLMLLSELKTIMEDAMQKHRPNSNNTPIDCSTVPLVLCGDFNSLPDSGVIELMRNGKISLNHADFKDLRYESYLQKISRVDVNSTQSTDIVHHFKLQSAYETTSSPIMPYTNYTYDFKGIIDYVFYSIQLMRVLGVLGPLDPEWLQQNKILGCPHPNVPSDHFSLLVEFELNPITNDLSTTNNSKTSTTPILTRRQ